MEGVQLTIEMDETLYLALRLRAAKQRVEPSAMVDAILRATLAIEVQEAAGVPPLASVIQYVVDARK